MIKKLLTLAAIAFTMGSCGASAPTGNGASDTATVNSKHMDQTTTTTDTASVRVKVSTTMGDFTVLLYGDTPRHRDNFVKLVNEGYYNGTLFHRVINEFMVQAGDPDSKGAPADKMLGSGGPGYQIDAEILYPRHFHKRYALAAARQGDQVNPMKKSSGSQFYIVTGRKVGADEMTAMERNVAMQAMQDKFNALARENMDSIRAMQSRGDHAGLEKLRQELIRKVESDTVGVSVPQTVKDAYAAKGGTPHLDNAYTVFGEVVDGTDVIDRIEKVPTGRADRPREDVKIISMQIVK